VGEYGSIIFIRRQSSMVSEIAPLLIVTKLEEFDYARRRHWGGDAGGVLHHAAGFERPPGLGFGAKMKHPLFHQSHQGPVAAAPDLDWRVGRVRGAVPGLPLLVVFKEALGQGIGKALSTLVEPDTLSSIKLSLLAAGIAVPLNTVFGICAAWAVAKFDFPGKTFLVTLIDLPFSVSPVVRA